jgi:hypothetical protein
MILPLQHVSWWSSRRELRFEIFLDVVCVVVRIGVGARRLKGVMLSCWNRLVDYFYSLDTAVSSSPDNHYSAALTTKAQLTRQDSFPSWEFHSTCDDCLESNFTFQLSWDMGIGGRKVGLVKIGGITGALLVDH